MSQAAHLFEGRSESRLLLIADHASNHVPDDIDLGVPADLMRLHVAYDIGVAALGGRLCEALAMPGVFAAHSRLIVDLNREEDAPGLIPPASDGHPIPANTDLSPAEREVRLARFFRPYHAAVEAQVAAHAPALLVSLHSFTPRLASAPDPRPWEIGILYNQDHRAPRVAIPLLRNAGIVTGDNEPYSGRVLNATMNRHAEAHGLPYLGLEVRQDLIDTVEGIAGWAARLAPVIAATRDALIDARPGG